MLRLSYGTGGDADDGNMMQGDFGRLFCIMFINISGLGAEPQ